MKAITWKNKARKQMKRIPKNYRAKILKSVAELKTFPACEGLDIKILTNHDYGFRLRVAR